VLIPLIGLTSFVSASDVHRLSAAAAAVVAAQFNCTRTPVSERHDISSHATTFAITLLQGHP